MPPYIFKTATILSLLFKRVGRGLSWEAGGSMGLSKAKAISTCFRAKDRKSDKKRREKQKSGTPKMVLLPQAAREGETIPIDVFSGLAQ